MTFGTLGVLAFPLLDLGDLEDFEAPSHFGFSEAALGSTTDLAAERGSRYQRVVGLKIVKHVI